MICPIWYDMSILIIWGCKAGKENPFNIDKLFSKLKNLRRFGLFAKYMKSPKRCSHQLHAKAQYGYATTLWCKRECRDCLTGDSCSVSMGRNCPSSHFKSVLWQVKMCEGRRGMEKRNLISHKGKCVDNLSYSFWLSASDLAQRTLHGMFLRAEWYPGICDCFLNKTHYICYHCVISLLSGWSSVQRNGVCFVRKWLTVSTLQLRVSPPKLAVDQHRSATRTLTNVWRLYIGWLRKKSHFSTLQNMT